MGSGDVKEVKYSTQAKNFGNYGTFESITCAGKPAVFLIETFLYVELLLVQNM